MVEKKDNGMKLIIIGALLLLAPFAYGYISGGSLPGIGGLEQKKVICDVTVGNPLLGNVKIEDVSCSAGKDSLFVVSGIQTKPFAFLGARDDITVVLKAGGKTKTSTLKIYETTSKTVTLSVTVASDVDSGIIQLLKGNVVSDQKNVNF